MAGDEKSCSSECDNSCGYCKKNVVSTAAKCRECATVFHASCALRVAGLIAVGKDNLVICCASKEVKLASTQVNFNQVSNVDTQERQLFQSLIVAKEEIISELHEKQVLLYKTIALLEEKNNVNNEKNTSNDEDIILVQENIQQKKGISSADKQKNPIRYKKKGDKNNQTYSAVTGGHKNIEKSMGCQKFEAEQEETNTVTLCETDSEAERGLHENNEEEGFTKFQRRKKRTFKKRLGTESVTEEQEKNGFVGIDRKAWLYINRVRSHVTADVIKEYIIRKPGFEKEVIDVQELSLNDKRGIKSFLVKAPLRRKDELYQPEFWPLNVGIKRFNFNLYKKNRPTGDFL